MSEINHNQIESSLDNCGPDEYPPVCLIHGQEVLVESALQRLVERLLGGADRNMCCDIVEGFAENVQDALERMNTFALLGGPKIVVFKEAKLVETRSDHPQTLDKIETAFKAGDTAQSARLFFNLCRRLQIDPRLATDDPTTKPELTALGELIGKSGLLQLVQYGLERDWSTAERGDPFGALRDAIAKGFPQHHHLVVTAGAKVPKNLKIYKTIRDRGLIVDCSVPSGGRRVDKIAQQKVLRETLNSLLADSDKRLADGLFESLCRLTGFDLRVFTQNVEKLIDYSGPRSEINAQDIEAVLRETKSDPVYEFTNAVADRDGAKALLIMNRLFRDKWHPLQVLSALANQIRKLLVAKDFTQSDAGRAWISGMSYPQFQQRVMPVIEAYDNQIQLGIETWHDTDSGISNPSGALKKKAADMRLAPNPRNAYPVYQALIKSDKFSHRALVDAMSRLHQADLTLKSSGPDAGIVLTSLLLEICGGR
jgi:DNA polymerase-3 subunit delta